MRAMILKKLGSMRDNPNPLTLVDLPDLFPGPDELLIRVHACGVCHTELDEIEGRSPPLHLPITLGHQVVGRVEGFGKDVKGFKIGDRVGVAWIFSACGHCRYCLRGEENLCIGFLATGRDAQGGYAEMMTVFADFAHHIPDAFTDVQAAPLLCAGAVGYRSLRLGNLKNGQSLGFTGFGASAHLVLQLARYLYPRSKIYVFARREEERAFAMQLGAAWAGNTKDQPPEQLHAIIDTTPAWTPVVEALKSLEPGGQLIINAIRKEEADKEALLKIGYPEHLWLEKEIKTVANVTRDDVREFMKLAVEAGIKPEVQEYKLEDANQALMDLKLNHIRGAKVLRMN